MTPTHVPRWHRLFLSLGLALLLVTILPLTQPTAAYAATADQERLLYDDDEIFTPAQESTLNRVLTDVSRKTQMQISVVFSPVKNGDVAGSAAQYFDSRGLGYGSRRNGVLLFVSVASRDMHLLSNGRAHDILRREGLRRIGTTTRPFLSRSDWVDAVKAFAKQSERELSAYTNRSLIFPRDPLEALPPLIIALIAFFVAKHFVTANLENRVSQSRSLPQKAKAIVISFGIDEQNEKLIRSKEEHDDIPVYHSYFDDDDSPRSSFWSGSSRSSSGSSSFRGWSSSSSSRGGFSSKF